MTNETEVAAALLAQHERQKRSRFCLGQVGRPHIWRRFGNLQNTVWEACIVCDVTRSPDDYENRRAAKR